MGKEIVIIPQNNQTQQEVDSIHTFFSLEVVIQEQQKE